MTAGDEAGECGSCDWTIFANQESQATKKKSAKDCGTSQSKMCWEEKKKMFGVQGRKIYRRVGDVVG